MNNTNRTILYLLISVMVFGFTASSALASFQPSCSFAPQTGRVIIHSEDQVLSGGIRADAGIDRAYKPVSGYIPAGTYNVSLQAFDGGEGSDRGDQPHEQYYVALKNGNTLVAQTNATTDLPDHVSTPVWYGQVNSNLVLAQDVNVIIAAHPYYPDSNPNSVNIGCMAFDLVTPPTPELNVSCSAISTNPQTNSPITWQATASGGSGSYTYSWVGTDGLSGSSQTISKTYSTAGTKVATVTVTSGSRTKTANCNVALADQTPNLSIACTPSVPPYNVGEPLTWTATALGGIGSYTYSWAGTDGLTGTSSSITKTYLTAGTKTATITVTSGSESKTASCSATVAAVIPNLTASCSASPSAITTGQSSTFIGSANGGTGVYTYSWSGACSGTGITCSDTFSTTGTKTANLTVTSGTQTATANCAVVVTPPTQNLTATCSSNPNAIEVGQSSTFIANATGGNGTYTYSWSGACSGSGLTCYNTYSTSGIKTANLTVTSNGQTASTSCLVSVTSNPINVSCYASPSSITSGQSTAFTANATGGSGSYTYSWSGVCTGYGSTCSNNVYGSGSQSATVTVTSGSQSNTATCSVNIGQSCTPNYQQRCIGTTLYWYDSCGNQGSYIGTCGNTCTPNYQQRCVGTSLYWYDSCGNQQNYVGSCGNTTTNLTVTKTVRNLTTGTAFASSTYARPSDLLMYMITLQVTGNQNAQNVYIRDVLPANLTYNNQLVVACTGTYSYNNSCNSNNYNYTGSITSGISLGTIYTGQTVTITYQTQVAPAGNFTYGTTTLNNIVNTTSSNVSYIPTATASVIVTKSGVLGASTISTGLTNNFWVDSFFLPLFITLILIWMWKAGMFFGIERWLDNKRKIKRGYKAEKELSARIAQIQKTASR